MAPWDRQIHCGNAFALQSRGNPENAVAYLIPLESDFSKENLMTQIVDLSSLLSAGAKHGESYCRKYFGETEKVSIIALSNVKYIEVPTSDNPILTWMEARRGIYPKLNWPRTIQVKGNK
ncbi:hypothetical protein NQ317_018389 [Molorchus minor]|uniref:Uncharacterized protein n=1 Tax=Molorchus minor TaxID=1323400 RepID=A0ABQ9J6P5_9CUCU|nr:hypothetical protein NQ317_018389 [Molorchus minor]